MAERYHHGALAQTLIAVALDAIDAGEAVPSLREVARRAGVSAMAPYRHFADHSALMAAVSGQGFERLRLVLEVADAVDDAAAAIVRQGRAYIDFALANPALFRLMFAGGPAYTPTPDDGAFGILARRTAALAPQVPVAALACWSLVHGLATLALDQRLGALDPAAMAEAITLLVDGMRHGHVSTSHAG